MATKGVIGIKGYSPAGSGNELTVQPGSLLEADHVVFPATAKARSRNGEASLRANAFRYYVDNDSTDASTNRAETMYQWGTHLLVHHSGGKVVSFTNVFSGVTYTLVGTFAAPSSTQRMKFAEMAKSVYWTTSAGLYALDSITGTARAAGLPSPLGPRPTSNALSGNPNATGSWFAKNNATAGRAVLGYKDANGVVHLSAAGPRVVQINPADVVVAIGGLVRNANVVTATVTAHNFKVGDILDLTLTGGDVGNFDTTNNVVTSVTSTTIVWSETAGNYTNVAEVTITSGTKSLSWAFYVGSGLSTSHFLQLYRTLDSGSASVDPGDEMFLAYERYLTATDVSNTYVTISDTTPEDFLGEPLDSNANSGEGVLGSNDRVPLCRDICTWDGRLWGAQTSDRQSMSLRLLGVGSPNGLQSGDVLLLDAYAIKADGGWSLVSQYLASRNVHDTLNNMAVNVNVTGGAIALAYAMRVAMDDAVGSTFGRFNIEALSITASAFYAATTRPSAFAEPLPSAVAVTEASSSRTANVVTITATAHGLLTGEYALLSAYTADANFPGGRKGPITKINADSFTYAEAGSAVTMSGEYYVGKAQFVSDNNQQQVRFSRAGIPEAWPLANALGGLPDNAEVLRIKPTPDNGELMVFLTNGDIYAVGGQYPYNVRRADGSASLVAADSLVEHANQLYGLTTQGPAVIGGSGVGLIGGDIEDEWRELVANINNLSTQANVWSMSYESARQWHLWIPSSSGVANRCLVFDSLKKQWSRRTSIQRKCGLVFKGQDIAILGHGDTTNPSTGNLIANQLMFERKLFGSSQHLSFADGLFAGRVNGAQSSVSTVTVHNVTPFAVGDFVDFGATGTTFYRITAGNGTTSMTVDGTVTVTNNQSAIIYRAIPQTVTFAVDTGQAPGIEKQWREIQLHFGRRHFRSMSATFQTEHAVSTAAVTIAPTDYVFGTIITGVSTVRVEIPASMRQGAMLTVTLAVSEAFMFFDLLGYSMTAEPISERTGK